MPGTRNVHNRLFWRDKGVAEIKKLDSFYDPGLGRINLGFGNGAGMGLCSVGSGKLGFVRIAKIGERYPVGYE